MFFLTSQDWCFSESGSEHCLPSSSPPAAISSPGERQLDITILYFGETVLLLLSSDLFITKRFPDPPGPPSVALVAFLKSCTWPCHASLFSSPSSKCINTAGWAFQYHIHQGEASASHLCLWLWRTVLQSVGNTICDSAGATKQMVNMENPLV